MNRILGFNGLRAIAVILVFCEHKVRYAGIDFYYFGLDLGKLGVWTFFFISGFLIIGELHRGRIAIENGQRRAGEELRTFFVKRALRIFPPYYVLLTLLFLVRGYYTNLGPHIGFPWHYAYLSNVWMGYVLNDTLGPFTPFWSLAVEQQFYLLAPFALLAAPSRHHAPLLLGIAGASALTHVALYADGATFLFAYMLSPWNFAILSLGGLCYMAAAAGYRVNTALGFTGAAVTAVLVAHVGLFWFVPYAWNGVFDVAETVAIGTVFLWVATNQGNRIVRALEWQPLFTLGKVSYAFYLIHALLPNKLKDLVPAYPLLSNVAGTAATFAIAVALSLLSWRFLEQPILRLKPRLTGGAARARPAATPVPTSPVST